MRVTYHVPEGILSLTHTREACGEDFLVLQVRTLCWLRPIMGLVLLQNTQLLLGSPLEQRQVRNNIYKQIWLSSRKCIMSKLIMVEIPSAWFHISREQKLI